MRAQAECPPLDSLQALFADTLPPEERERRERHLESCPACQERLHRAEEAGDALRKLGRRVGDPTLAPADTILVQVLERLHEVKGLEKTAALEPADLYFLHPTDRPELLGMLGTYEVQEVIGQGGMGVVLKAFEPALHRLVAIKVLAAAVAGSATARRRFSREAQAAAAVCHDHIVAVHGVHEIDGLPYLVMQYVPGESLQDRLDRTGPLEVVEIVRIGLQTAAGLAAAHAQGLIHRDIKPANLLLEDGLARVKITDFGLARMADDVQLTQAGVVAGTPEYMAPEQAAGEPIDHRADLFSLGSVLYACCTGLPPFHGATALAVLRQVSDQAPRPIRVLNPDVPAWLEALVARLLAKKPADRFQSAAEVAALLEGYLAHLRQPATISAPELPRAPAGCPESEKPGLRTRVRWQFSRRLWSAALLLLAPLGLLLFLMAQGRAPDENLHDHLVFDFRGRPLPAGMGTFGAQPEQFIKVEPEGLRLTLSRDRGDAAAVGLSMPLALGGDFEITTAFEVLHADEPAPGTRSYGVGLLMSVNESARIGRLARANGKQVVSFDHWVRGDGDPKFVCGARERTGKTGRLRLKRTATTLLFLWAPGTAGENFDKVYQWDDYGDTDVTLLRLELNTDLAGQPGQVDVRLLDLKIRSNTAPPERVVVPEEGRGDRSNRWLVAAGILAGATLFFLVACLVVRQTRRNRKAPSQEPEPEGQAKSEAAAASVSVQCSGCGKSLKGKAELAGKKVKCPQCGQALLIPGSKSGDAGRVSS